MNPAAPGLGATYLDGRSMVSIREIRSSSDGSLVSGQEVVRVAVMRDQRMAELLDYEFRYREAVLLAVRLRVLSKDVRLAPLITDLK